MSSSLYLFCSAECLALNHENNSLELQDHREGNLRPWKHYTAYISRRAMLKYFTQSECTGSFVTAVDTAKIPFREFQALFPSAQVGSNRVN